MNRLISLLFTLLLLVSNLSATALPFAYDLHLTLTPGDSSKIMICAHGMGGNYTIANSINIDKTLVSFNFPDHDYHTRLIKARKTSFGTIDELLPFLYVIKECVIIDGNNEIDLYGFSAGGGAVVNVLAVLNTSRYDDRLKEIGIEQEEKETILQAIQKGQIILDTPLKSLEEIIAYRGPLKELTLIAKRYKKNDMIPIESLKYLQGLSLNVIVHFQNPDEVLSNRDDQLFFDTLKHYNSLGTTRLITGHDHGHSLPHPSLWNNL